MEQKPGFLEKAERFRKTPPVGRRMAGHMRRRKRSMDRTGWIPVGNRGPISRIVEKVGDLVMQQVYIKGPRRVDHNRTRSRRARNLKTRTAKRSRIVNRLVVRGQVRYRLSRLATRFDWRKSA